MRIERLDILIMIQYYRLRPRKNSTLTTPWKSGIHDRKLRFERHSPGPTARCLQKRPCKKLNITIRRSGSRRCIETSKRWLRKDGFSLSKFQAIPRATRSRARSTIITFSAMNAGNSTNWRDASPGSGPNCPEDFVRPVTSSLCTAFVQCALPVDPKRLPDSC